MPSDILARLDAAFTRADGYLSARTTRADAYNEDTVLREHGPKIAGRLKTDPSAESLIGTGGPKEAVAHFAEQDPSGPKKAYTPWMAREYGRGNIERLEDAPRAATALDLFHRHKAKLPVEQRNIAGHSLHSLESAVKPFEKLLLTAGTLVAAEDKAQRGTARYAAAMEAGSDNAFRVLPQAIDIYNAAFAEKPSGYAAK